MRLDNVNSDDSSEIVSKLDVRWSDNNPFGPTNAETNKLERKILRRKDDLCWLEIMQTLKKTY